MKCFIGEHKGKDVGPLDKKVSNLSNITCQDI